MDRFKFGQPVKAYTLLSVDTFRASIATEYLERWVLCSRFASLSDLCHNISLLELFDLALCAERAGFLAFVCKLNPQPDFALPEFCRGDALYAFADFIREVA